MSPGDSEAVLKSLHEASFTSAIHARLRLTISKVGGGGRMHAPVYAAWV